ncbi:hypothetical protein A6E15_19355 [Natrinema saccharevitans]|uniref:Uncharacterized protein n=1 Tax=Natrinema saccharevitans TaxID=301967 RepID=A0A1S8AR37_9EURY|nr:hypothetical protein A6E15_19355 [Natrinema saccharevitans]
MNSVSTTQRRTVTAVGSKFALLVGPPDTVAVRARHCPVRPLDLTVAVTAITPILGDRSVARLPRAVTDTEVALEATRVGQPPKVLVRGRGRDRQARGDRRR